MKIRAVVDANIAGRWAMVPLRGVPLALWPVRALLTELDRHEIAVLSDDEHLAAALARHGVQRAEFLPPGVLTADARRPFVSRQTVRSALQEHGPRAPMPLHAFSAVCRSSWGSIEALSVSDEQDVQVVHAVATGLAPDHPCIAGIGRLRLPLALDIRAIISDVDGTLTDGGISFNTESADAGRTFNTHDGLGTHLLLEAGIKVAWISATSSSASIQKRAAMLNIPIVDTGTGPKGPRFLEVCGRLGIDPRQAVYIGDDVNDLPAMELAGAGACPSDARPEVRARVDVILDAPGGHGAFRELADIILAGRALTPRSQ